MGVPDRRRGSLQASPLGRWRPPQSLRDSFPSLTGEQSALVRSALQSLTLTDFRSYERAELAPGGRSVFLFGPNGAGKTNLLEAISLLSPGRGMRAASLAELGRRAAGRGAGPRLGGLGGGRGRRRARCGSAPGVETRRRGAAARCASRARPCRPAAWPSIVRPLWLTPAQDRLFLEGAAERRRFFDRLVFAAEPIHAAHVGAYERALRERTRLLADEAPPIRPGSPRWRRRMAEAGARVAEARAATLERPAGRDRPARRPPVPAGRARPHRRLGDSWRSAGATLAEIEARLAAALAAGRAARRRPPDGR